MLNLICADLLLLLTLTQDGAVGEFVNTSLPSRTNRDAVSLVFVLIGKVLVEVGVPSSGFSIILTLVVFIWRLLKPLFAGETMEADVLVLHQIGVLGSGGGH